MNEIVKWVKIVVLRTMREKSLKHLDADILISAGMLGYSQARQRFDPSREVKFKTFAEYRIKGAVLDEVRKMIGDERCKNPRPRQVDYDFERMGDDGDEVSTMHSQMVVDGFWDSLSLSKRDRGILECRVKGMNLREIGEEFGFSESRASQILADIKRQIYPSFQKHLGRKIKLASFVCPSCQHPNEQSDRSGGFDCERCDSTVEIKAGVPILKDLELSEKDGQ
jgi:RNA polymerase sigma factor (sigma-70 family)